MVNNEADGCAKENSEIKKLLSKKTKSSFNDIESPGKFEKNKVIIKTHRRQ